MIPVQSPVKDYLSSIVPNQTKYPRPSRTSHPHLRGEAEASCKPCQRIPQSARIPCGRFQTRPG
ncbi:hypothetical protein BDM02DRAFT_3121925 [Thelephora ganbajun]|uniref:Uncharacterized protein n=1 Tax=Thelephora ganbajun TaxID=370292 RepID=A0ACB6Z4J1_THEGA|nr:hypothetical protein BDM02DRAFT_3121925 [Thelephora ganbajun]